MHSGGGRGQTEKYTPLFLVLQEAKQTMQISIWIKNIEQYKI